MGAIRDEHQRLWHELHAANARHAEEVRAKLDAIAELQARCPHADGMKPFGDGRAVRCEECGKAVPA